MHLCKEQLIMKSKLTYFIITAIVSIIITACNNDTDNGVIEIFIDFSQIEELDLTHSKKTNLEFTENSIIRRIDELLFYDNKYYVIRSRGDLYVFDYDGSFKTQIGSRGNGPMEFTHFNSFFIKNNVASIYDAMARKIITYDLNGKYLNSTTLSGYYDEITPNYIYPITDNKFISKNTYGGDNRKTPSYSILDMNYHIISNSEKRYLKNGITTLNNFFAEHEYLLFWEPLNDTIFSVTNNESYSPKYYVNFNKKSLPSRIKKLDLYEAIEFSNRSENKERYASLIRCVSEDKLYVRFIFLYNEDVYYVKYGKQEEVTKIYKFVYTSNTIEPLIYLHEDKLIVPVNDLEDVSNPSLVIVNESLL